ncbi:MAG TPA: TonB-dependent receptor plug domain-containing protein [Gemmatimonadaceae bacterium]
MRTTPRGQAVTWWTVLAVVSIGTACSATLPTHQTLPAAQDSVPGAYGSTARSRSADAVGTLTERDIDAMQPSQLIQLLQGRVAGAYVVRNEFGEYDIRIRGASSSVAAGGQPLYVVDGTPVGGHGLGNVLATIPPSEIARIDVLKDAGATGLYGLHGANGVILITTKHGPSSSAAP